MIDLTNYFLNDTASDEKFRFEEGWDIYSPRLVKTQLDRVQVVIGPQRYAVLVRHYTQRHWCGYVPVRHQISFHAKETLIRAAIKPRISFVGYGNEWISWCATDAKGKLTVPIRIIDSDNPDKGVYWVGFDLRMAGEEANQSNIALTYLYAFEESLRRFEVQ